MAQENTRVRPSGFRRGSARTTSPRPGTIGHSHANAKQKAKSLLIAPTQVIKDILDKIERIPDVGTGKVGRRKKSTLVLSTLVFKKIDDPPFIAYETKTTSVDIISASRVDPETKERSYPELLDFERKEAINLVKFVRDAIANLTIDKAGIKPGDPQRNIILNHLRSILYRLLNAKTPYYSQILSRDIAMTSKAWRNTCGVTSLAMTLEALGVTATDFRGEKDKLKRIAKHYGIADPVTLRLPDFLQLVAICNSPRIKGVDASKLTPPIIISAQRDAALKTSPYKFTITPNLMDYTKLFGVTVTRRFLFKDIEKKHPDFDSLTKTKKKNIYKSEAIKSLLGELSKGKEIVVGVGKVHYVRLQDVSESGLIIDDPWHKGNAATVRWQQALNKEYGRVYLILRK